jgi:predicted nucleic acid-binding protein
MVVQALAAADRSLSESELLDAVNRPLPLALLRLADARTTLRKLVESGRVTRDQGLYALSLQDREAVLTQLREAESRHAGVCRTLFEAAKGGWRSCVTPFDDLMCSVFSHLADVYALELANKKGETTVAAHEFLATAVEDVIVRHSVLDPPTFRSAIGRFFRESQPDFDAIKWNFAQNFYVLKALGADTGAHLLSRDLFHGATFYLDTNVLIGGLLPESRHHESFTQACLACRGLDVHLKVTQETVTEFRHVLHAHGVELARVVDRIPDATVSRVNSFLLQPFLAEKARNSALTVPVFVDEFEREIDSLREKHGVELVDAPWFVSERDASDTVVIAGELVRISREIAKRPKTDTAARHDALVLRWVSKEAQDARIGVGVLTLDRCMARVTVKGERPMVMGLDALLQWSVIQRDDGVSTNIAQLYSEALRYSLLPPDVFFDLNDFIIFAEMEIETAQLPADQVEACVREIKSVGLALDPTKAEDRERIGRTVQRYFADPGGKYQRHLQEQDRAHQKLESDLAAERAARRRAEEDAREAALKVDHERGRSQVAIDEERRARLAAEDKAKRLDGELGDASRREKLLVSAVLRTVFSFGVLVAVWLLEVWWLHSQVRGGDFVDKLPDWYWIFGVPIVPWIVVLHFALGPERRAIMKFWKGD